MRRLFERYEQRDLCESSSLAKDNMLLRRPTGGDRSFWHKLFSNKDTNSALGCWSETKKEFTAELRAAIAAWGLPEKRRWDFIIEVDNRPVGVIGLYPNGSANYRAEFSVAILPGERRHGYAAQALRLLLRFAAGQDIKRVVGRCYLENHGCSRTMEAAGFQFEGIERQGFYAKGRYHDSRIYSFITDCVKEER